MHRGTAGAFTGGSGWIVALAGSLVLGLGTLAHAQEAPAQTVRVGAVSQQTLQERWPVIGRLREVRRSIVAAEQFGRIVAINVDQGDAVEGGVTELARIDNVWAKLNLAAGEANLAQAKAGVAEAQANLNQANRELAYLEDLGARGSAKPKEVDDARSAAEAAKARLDRAHADVLAAEASLARAQENVSRLNVIAPFDGLVVAKHTEVGQWVDAGDAVVEIISRGQIDAVIDVPERLINDVELGERVEVRLTGLNIEAQGVVESITPTGATAARTFPVKVRLQDERGLLKAGMSVTAMIPAGRETPLLTVPRDALLRSPAGDVIWAAVDNQAVKVPVKVLFGVADRYAVEVAPAYFGPPVVEGTQVVIEGGERLAFPGQPLNILPPDEGRIEAADTQATVRGAGT